jgi:tripartite-type tricarboxylate transporter receptor subunit TctC
MISRSMPHYPQILGKREMNKVHMIMRRRACSAVFAIACWPIDFLGSDAAMAQAWPTRSITVVVPLAAGSASDVIARLVLDQVSKQVGQPIVIENRGGAGGTIGSNIVAKAAPDGYTILAAGGLASAHALYAKLPYATLEDFAPVIPLGQQPMVLLTAQSKGFKTVGELIAAAKVRPGTLNFASVGIGSASHFAAERLRVSAGIEAQHIMFKGAAEALTDVIAGRVDFIYLPIAAALPLIKDGKLAALAVNTSKRAVALPEVSTTTEAGLVDSASPFWSGLFLPAKTPRDIVVKLHQETEKALQLHSMQERLAELGVEPMPMSPEQFDKYFRDEVEADVKLVKAANIPTQ